MGRSATYKEIQKWVRREFGFEPATCWIANCKEIYGLRRSNAPNRRAEEHMKPCPLEKRQPISAAFQHFGMLP
jgi:hypothetical protein